MDKIIYIFITSFAVINAAGVEPTVEQINNVNIAELIAGPQIDDTLKILLINCLSDNATKPAYCPSEDIPISDAVKRLLEISEKADPTTPQNGGNSKRGHLGHRIVASVKRIPANAKKSAEALVAFAGSIITITKKPDPLDPFQDISQYVKTKQPSNINYSLTGAVKNKKELINEMASTNENTVRRFGMNYDHRVPNVLIAGMIRTDGHL